MTKRTNKRSPARVKKFAYAVRRISHLAKTGDCETANWMLNALLKTRGNELVQYGTRYRLKMAIHKCRRMSRKG